MIIKKDIQVIPSEMMKPHFHHIAIALKQILWIGIKDLDKLLLF